MQHPLSRASQLQELIENLKQEVAGKEVEYRQILEYCREHKIVSQDGFAVSTKLSTRRIVDPKKFAAMFPEENKILVAKLAAFMGTELDKLTVSKLLPNIRVEDAKELVGNRILDDACIISVSEKVTIVKEKEQ